MKIVKKTTIMTTIAVSIFFILYIYLLKSGVEYNEEDDLCRRARKQGKKICFFPETSVQHMQGQSTHQNRYREKVILKTYQSNLYFYSKYYSCFWNLVLRFLYKASFFIGLVRSGLRHLKKSNTTEDSLSFKMKLLLMSPKNFFL